MSGTDFAIETGSDISTFVENSLKQIKTGIENSGFGFSNTIDFDLEVTEKKEGGAEMGFKQFIKIGGKKENENTQRIKFSVFPEYK